MPATPKRDPPEQAVKPGQAKTTARKTAPTANASTSTPTKAASTKAVPAKRAAEPVAPPAKKARTTSASIPASALAAGTALMGGKLVPPSIEEVKAYFGFRAGRHRIYTGFWGDIKTYMNNMKIVSKKDAGSEAWRKLLEEAKGHCALTSSRSRFKNESNKAMTYLDVLVMDIAKKERETAWKFTRQIEEAEQADAEQEEAEEEAQQAEEAGEAGEAYQDNQAEEHQNIDEYNEAAEYDAEERYLPTAEWDEIVKMDDDSEEVVKEASTRILATQAQKHVRSKSSLHFLSATTNIK